MVAEVTFSGRPAGNNGIETLQARLRGELIRPVDAGYEQARKTWSGNVDRRPAYVVRAADAIDVMAAVEFAREQGLTVAVRSGGHSIAGQSTLDGGIIIDLSRMKAMSIDPERKVAWVQPGLTWGEYANAAQDHGLATSSGDASAVGVGGLTLGGGIGWMVRKQGLTIDNLLSAEVVTADGRLLRASESENADLFWALRGGGGNFGIVTSLEFRLHDVGMIVGGGVIYPADEAERIIREAIDYAAYAPDELTTMVIMMPAPPAPFVPAEWVGQPSVVIAVCYSGEIEQGLRAVAPLRALGTPIADIIGPMPYPAQFMLTEDAVVPGRRDAVRSTFLDAVNDELIETIADFGRRPTAPVSMAQIRVLGGAMARVDPQATAFPHRHKPFMCTIINSWEQGEGDDATHRAWTEQFWQAVRPHGSGVYVNFLANEGEARVREAYGEENLRRLAAIKQKYDPTNFFHMNQNVRPQQ